MAVLYPFLLFFLSCYTVFLNLLFNDREMDNRNIETWARISCRMFGVDVRLVGAENIPKGGCLFLFNHTSFFDIFAMHWKLRGARFGAKIELFRFPMFGLAMRRVGTLPIARNHREEVIELYKQTAMRVKSGEQFCLAPEGTRQEEEKLGPLKTGPFVLAINSQSPIVPVVIIGASQILKKGGFVPNGRHWHMEIQMNVLPAIDTSQYSIEQRHQLQEEFRKRVAAIYAV